MALVLRRPAPAGKSSGTPVFPKIVEIFLSAECNKLMAVAPSRKKFSLRPKVHSTPIFLNLSNCVSFCLCGFCLCLPSLHIQDELFCVQIPLCTSGFLSKCLSEATVHLDFLFIWYSSSMQDFSFSEMGLFPILNREYPTCSSPPQQLLSIYLVN